MQSDRFFGEPKFCELDLRVLLLAVHEVLLRSERVTDIKWYPQFDTPEYLKLITASSSPIRTKLDQHQQHALIGIEERGTRLINRIVSPAGAVATLALVVVMMIAIPMHVAQITGLLFIAFIVAMVLWPLVMSLLVASEARKKMTRSTSRPSLYSPGKSAGPLVAK